MSKQFSPDRKGLYRGVDEVKVEEGFEQDQKSLFEWFEAAKQKHLSGSELPPSFDSEFHLRIVEAARWCDTALTMRRFEEVVEMAQLALEAAGVLEAGKVSPRTSFGALAIAEATNLGAKMISWSFYGLKPCAVVAAWKSGCGFGLGNDGCYYLSDPVVGTASFHDPSDDISYLITEVLREPIPRWGHEWSGVDRQEHAFDVLRTMSDQAMPSSSLVEQLRDATLPISERETRRFYMKNASARLAVMSDFLKKRETKK